MKKNFKNGKQYICKYQSILDGEIVMEKEKVKQRKEIVLGEVGRK